MAMGKKRRLLIQIRMFLWKLNTGVNQFVSFIPILPS